MEQQDSYFNNFYIIKDKVYYDCFLELRNRGFHQAEIEISARSQIDYQNGLISSPELATIGTIPENVEFASEDDFSERVFPSISSKSLLQPINTVTIAGCTTKTYRFIFAGVYGKNPQKADRLLPTVVIKGIN